MKMNMADWDIYCLTDARLSLGRGIEEVVQAMLQGGAKVIQYREKDKKSGVMLQECRTIRAMTREAGCCFIVNDHVDIALLCDADGVHVGQEDLPVAEVRRLVGQDKIVGLSTHSPEEYLEAVAAGVDYIGVGPIFFTRTKKDVCAPVGISYLDYAVARARVPFVAIGGIKMHNIDELAAHGAQCCALVSEIVGATDIAAAVSGLRTQLHAARTMG